MADIHEIEACADNDATAECTSIPVLPIARPFTWYALVFGDSSLNYNKNIYELGTFRTLNEYCQYRNHVPEPHVAFNGHQCLCIAKKYQAYGYCIFEEGVRPEWEDPGNIHGIDLVCKLCCSLEELQTTWDKMVLMLINGRLEEATGLRLLLKKERRGVAYKYEIWCRDKSDASKLIDVLRDNTGLDFFRSERRG